MVTRSVRAVLLDVDGTLYHQEPLRFLMALELSALPLVRRSYGSASRVWRSLRCFRRVREELRLVGALKSSLADLQYVETAKRAGVNSVEIEQVVAEWIYRRPLKYLRFCKRRGIEQLLAFLESNKIQIGVFSDYPVADKLRALGLSRSVTLMLCATDPDINAFKPHPKGFLRACAIWGLVPEEVLYIGDRPEVDAPGAAAAGMPCAILTRKLGRQTCNNCSTGYSVISSFGDLYYAFTTDVWC